MRTRLLGLWNTFSHTFNGRAARSVFAAAGFGTTAGAAAYAVHQYQQDKIINRELTTHSEMRDYRESLRQSFLRDNAERPEVSISFNALLKAISSNDTDIAEEMLNDLVQADAVMSPETRDGLIVYTSNHSKIEALELLQKVFSEEDVMRNRHARDLLLLSPEERKIVTHITEEFYQSPGEIRHDGMVEFVKAKQQDLLEQHLHYRTYRPVYNFFDAAEDIAETYRQVRSAQDITEEMETKFKRTIVLDLTDYPHYEQVFEDYLRVLARAAKEENQPVVGTYVLTGAHFTLGQIEVVHREPDTDSAALVYIDPKGSYSSILTNDYNFISSLPHHVFKDVKVWISEDKNQLAGMGCSLFVADQYGILMTLDQIMSWNTQYPFAGNKDVIFDYAKNAETSSHLYGVDFDGSDGDTGSFKSLAKFTLFLLPAALIVGKQSLDSLGVKDDAPETFVLEKNGRYSVIVEKDSKMDFPGVMGYNRARMHSSPNRQIEFNRPADISGTKTVDETVQATIENAEHKGHVKPRNKRNDNTAYEFGLFLSKNAKSILAGRKKPEQEKPEQEMSDDMKEDLVDFNLEERFARDMMNITHRKN